MLITGTEEKMGLDLKEQQQEEWRLMIIIITEDGRIDENMAGSKKSELK